MLRRLSAIVLVALPAACAGGATGGSDAAVDALASIFPRWTDAGVGLLCRETTRPLPFDPRPADVLVIFDRSGSMAAAFGAGSRYDVAADLLGDLVEAYQDKIRFGFQPFPARRECAAGQTAGCCADRPAVGVGPNNARAIRDAIEEAAPVDGNTPTASALRLAREYLRELDDGVADRYVLLSTDGRPSCSLAGRLAEPDLLDAEGRRIGGACHDALLEVEALVEQGVKVIVLGIGPGLENDPGGRPSCLDELARKGGAPRPGGRPSFFPAADPPQLEAALQQVFAGVTRPTCTLELRAAPADPAQVAVFLDGHEVPRNREHGWDFEALPDTRRIRFHGAYCRRLDRFQVATVEVRFGCPPCTDPATCE